MVMPMMMLFFVFQGIRCFANGFGVDKKDPAQATELLEKGASMGNAGAMVNVVQR